MHKASACTHARTHARTSANPTQHHDAVFCDTKLAPAPRAPECMLEVVEARANKEHGRLGRRVQQLEIIPFSITALQAAGRGGSLPGENARNGRRVGRHAGFGVHVSNAAHAHAQVSARDPSRHVPALCRADAPHAAHLQSA